MGLAVVLKVTNPLFIIIFILIALRLVSMVIFPYADTSEPRYAEIARIMATSGDWITPWFEPGNPFWGKPPLSFWFQAMFIKLFGVAEWTARLPSWLAMLATSWVIFKCGLDYAGRRTAFWAFAIYATCALPYISSGAVLTDPYLALGTTLCMAGLLNPSTSWRLLGFLGLAIGLLAKGPLALVLVLGPIIMCLLVFKQRFWPPIPTSTLMLGMSLITILVLPWYVLAELKTPGFLDYFIVGEHFRRYLDPGWAGDIYGSAHLKPYGSIWPLWIVATFPWGIIGLVVVSHSLVKKSARQFFFSAVKDVKTFYFLCWALFSLIFFTFAGNILWTYVLPAIPAFSILLGKKIAESSKWKELSSRYSAVIMVSALLIPTAILGLTIAVNHNINILKTEKDLAQYVMNDKSSGNEIWYINNRPFSARYYSNGNAKLVKPNEFDQKLSHIQTEQVYVAVPKDIAKDFKSQHLESKSWESIPHASSRRFELLRITLSK